MSRTYRTIPYWVKQKEVFPDWMTPAYVAKWTKRNAKYGRDGAATAPVFMKTVSAKGYDTYNSCCTGIKSKRDAKRSAAKARRRYHDEIVVDNVKTYLDGGFDPSEEYQIDEAADDAAFDRFYQDSVIRGLYFDDPSIHVDDDFDTFFELDHDNDNEYYQDDYGYDDYLDYY